MINKKPYLRLFLGISIVPALILLSSLVACGGTTRYMFEEQTFDTEEELLKYAEGKLKQEIEIINQKEQLTTSDNSYSKKGEIKIQFDELDDKINKDISSSQIDVNDPNLKKVEGINAYQPDNPSPSGVILRSNDGLTLKADEVALRTNLPKICSDNQIKGYFFRNHFIRAEHVDDLESLKTRIDFGDKDKSKYIQVWSVNHDGSARYGSIPIFLRSDKDGNLKNEYEVKKLINNFLRTHSNMIYEVSTDEGKRYYTSNSIAADKMLFTNGENLYLPSNHGQSDYVIDIRKNDQHDYYGPNVSGSEFGIKQIVNPKLWHTIDTKDKTKNKAEKKLLENQRDNALVSEFFSILVPDIQIKDKLFNIHYLEKESDAYQEFMMLNAPEVWNKALELNDLLMQGQRNSILLKLPIMYAFIAEQIVKNRLSNECIKKTNEYFSKIGNYLNQVIKTVFPKSILESVKQKNKCWNLLCMFSHDEDNYQISSIPNLRFNLDYVRSEFPHLINAIKIAMLAVLNRVQLNSCFSYNPHFMNSIMDSKENELATNLAYEQVWKTFSTKSFHNFINAIKQNESQTTDQIKERMFAEFGFDIFFVVKTIENEYSEQSSGVLKKPLTYKQYSFFKNNPESASLVQAAGDDYGRFFLLSQKPTAKSVIKSTNTNQYKLFVAQIVKSFFKVAKLVTDSVNKIVINTHFFVNALKEFTEKNHLKSFSDTTKKIVLTANNFKNSGFFRAFCRVSNLVTEINNLIIDAWPEQNAQPVNKATYQFLDTNYFIDNNAIEPNKLKAIEPNYNEEFLKQIIKPTKINEPRVKSSIYTNGKIYPTDRIKIAKTDLLNQTICKGEHEINNIKIFYSLENIEKIAKELNDKNNTISALLNNETIFTNINQMQETVLNWCEQFINQIPNAESLVPITNKKNIQEITYYESYLKDNWQLSLYTLPYVDSNGLMSSCQNMNEIDLVKIFGKYYDGNQKKIIYDGSESPEIWRYFVFNSHHAASYVDSENKNLLRNYVVNMVIKNTTKYRFAKKESYSDLYQNSESLDNKIYKVNFDDLPEKTWQTVFKVRDIKAGKNLYFKDRQDAIDWKIKNTNINKNDKIIYVARFVYNDEYSFASVDKFREWVRSKMKLIKN